MCISLDLTQLFTLFPLSPEQVLRLCVSSLNLRLEWKANPYAPSYVICNFINGWDSTCINTAWMLRERTFLKYLCVIFAMRCCSDAFTLVKFLEITMDLQVGDLSKLYHRFSIVYWRLTLNLHDHILTSFCHSDIKVLNY